MYYTAIVVALYTDFTEKVHEPNMWYKSFGVTASVVFGIVILIVSPFYLGEFVVNKILGK
jgi:hypothetical protein